MSGLDIIKNFFPLLLNFNVAGQKKLLNKVADPEGIPPPPHETKLFLFHGDFSENQEKLINKVNPSL